MWGATTSCEVAYAGRNTPQQDEDRYVTSAWHQALPRNLAEAAQPGAVARLRACGTCPRQRQMNGGDFRIDGRNTHACLAGVT
jgi:hypothetical protein